MSTLALKYTLIQAVPTIKHYYSQNHTINSKTKMLNSNLSSRVHTQGQFFSCVVDTVP